MAFRDTREVTTDRIFTVRSWSRYVSAPVGAALRRRRSEIVPTDAALPDARRRRAWSLTGGFGLVLSLFVGVIAPTAAVALYYGFIASDIYLTEAKFAVRGTVEKLPDSPALQAMTQLTSLNSNQDAYIVAEYIGSLPMIEVVQKEHNLREIFARPEADFWARVDDGISAEKFRKYWNTMVRATVDNLSGIVTLEVKSFRREDGLALAKSILAESEHLVNEMSIRRNADAVRYSTNEVQRAEARVQTARLAMQDFRNQSGTLDPVKEAEATFKIASVMRAERMALENEIATSRRTLAENSPSLQVLNARLAALKDQIKSIEGMLTGTDAKDGKTASAALYKYEGLELERMFAEKVYVMSQASYERARQAADRQGIYVATFVQPALAEMALFPKRGRDVVVVFISLLGIWSVFALLAAAVKDHNL